MKKKRPDYKKFAKKAFKTYPFKVKNIYCEENELDREKYKKNYDKINWKKEKK